MQLVIHLGIVVAAEAEVASDVDIDLRGIFIHPEDLFIEDQVPVVDDRFHHRVKLVFHHQILVCLTFCLIDTDQGMEVHDFDYITNAHFPLPLLPVKSRKTWKYMSLVTVGCICTGSDPQGSLRLSLILLS